MAQSILLSEDEDNLFDFESEQRLEAVKQDIKAQIEENRLDIMLNKLVNVDLMAIF